MTLKIRGLMKTSLLKISSLLLSSLFLLSSQQFLKGDELLHSDQSFKEEQSSAFLNTLRFRKNNHNIRDYDAMGCIDLGSGSFKATLYTLEHISKPHTHISQMTSPRVIEHLKVKKTPIEIIINMMNDELLELTGSIEE